MQLCNTHMFSCLVYCLVSSLICVLYVTIVNTLCVLKGVWFLGKMSGKRLTSSQIASFLDSVHSEDYLDFSNDEESNYSPDEEDLDTTGDEDIGEQGERRTDLNNVTSDTMDENGSSEINMKRNSLWRKRSLIFNENQLQLLASTALPPELMELSNLIEFFLYLFPNQIFDNICNETNIYIRQKNPNSNIHYNSVDIRQFVGISLYMSILVRKSWNTSHQKYYVPKIFSSNQKFHSFQQQR